MLRRFLRWVLVAPSRRWRASHSADDEQRIGIQIAAPAKDPDQRCTAPRCIASGERRCFPGAAQHEAKRSGALQTRDRSKTPRNKRHNEFEATSRATRRSRASVAHFATWASRLITCRLGSPQNRAAAAMACRDTRSTPGTAGCGDRSPHSSTAARLIACSGAPAAGAAASLATRRIPELPCDHTGAMPGRILLAPVPHRSTCQPKR